MRILLSCLQDLRRHPIPAYRFWAEYFRHGLDEAGLEWTEVPGVDWAEGISDLSHAERAAWKGRTWGRTLDYLANEKKAGRLIELFLSYLYPVQIEPGAIAEMRRQGIPCVNFFCDNVREFTRVPAVYHPFDLHWVPEFEALPMYRRAAVNHLHLPMPVWIAPESRTPVIDEDDAIVFIGSEDALRRKLLGEAIGLGAPVKIYGRGWTGGEARPAARTNAPSFGRTLRNQVEFVRQRGVGEWLRKTASQLRPEPEASIPPEFLASPLSGPDFVRATKRSKVVLGVNRVPTFKRSPRNALTYSRLRDIEAPMMGACYLTEWTEGLATLYELGREIETYRTAEEMVDKINALRSDPTLRARLRTAGQRRALADHTIACSLRKIGDALGLNRP